MRDITILSQLKENDPGETKEKQQDLRSIGAYDNSSSLVAASLALAIYLLSLFGDMWISKYQLLLLIYQYWKQMIL